MCNLNLKDLWGELYKVYVASQSEDSISLEHLSKIDSLLLSSDVEHIRNG